MRDLGYSPGRRGVENSYGRRPCRRRVCPSPTARVALAAPTGKAAARMAESVAESIDVLSAADDEPIVAAASALQLIVPSTVHRLLGARGSDSFVTTFTIRSRSISLSSMRHRCCHCHSSMPSSSTASHRKVGVRWRCRPVGECRCGFGTRRHRWGRRPNPYMRSRTHLKPIGFLPTALSANFRVQCCKETVMRQYTYSTGAQYLGIEHV